MRVLSVFNGISCGRLALDLENIKVTSYISYEIDKFANDVALKNYPNDTYLGDVFNAKYEIADLLLGGSPCTKWSSARVVGRELTPDGEGALLFLEYYRALKDSEAKYFLYENNNSMSKEIKAFITEKLGVEPLMINTDQFLPQARRRLYWTNIRKDLPQITCNKELIDILESNVDSKYHLSEKMTAYAMASGTKTFYVKPEINQEYARPLTTAPNKRAGTTTYISIDFKEGGNSKTIRRLTPIEFERLQGLPDNYTYINGHKFEDSKRYKAIGNGWSIPVIQFLLKPLKEVES